MNENGLSGSKASKQKETPTDAEVLSIIKLQKQFSTVGKSI